MHDALSKIKTHSDLKCSLESEIKKPNTEENIAKMKEKIRYHDEMVDIWKQNVEKIKKERRKLGH